MGLARRPSGPLAAKAPDQLSNLVAGSQTAKLRHCLAPDHQRLVRDGIGPASRHHVEAACHHRIGERDVEGRALTTLIPRQPDPGRGVEKAKGNNAEDASNDLQENRTGASASATPQTDQLRLGSDLQ
jgi:hypothetical protein